MENAFDRIKNCGLPVVIYGMGNGADKLRAEFAERGIEFSGVFANDEFVRGQSYAGYKVIDYERAKKRFGKFCVVPAFGAANEKAMTRMREIAEEQLMICPELPLFGGKVLEKDFLSENRERIEALYHKTEDALSREIFEKIGTCTERKHMRYDTCLEFRFKLNLIEGDFIKDLIRIEQGKPVMVFCMISDGMTVFQQFSALLSELCPVEHECSLHPVFFQKFRHFQIGCHRIIPACGVGNFLSVGQGENFKFHSFCFFRIGIGDDDVLFVFRKIQRILPGCDQGNQAAERNKDFFHFFAFRCLLLW